VADCKFSLNPISFPQSRDYFADPVTSPVSTGHMICCELISHPSMPHHSCETHNNYVQLLTYNNCTMHVGWRQGLYSSPAWLPPFWPREWGVTLMHIQPSCCAVQPPELH